MVDPVEWFFLEIEYTINFFHSLSLGKMLFYFWPALLLDFPRFVLIDIFTFLYQIYFPPKFENSDFAKRLRGSNPPLVSILLPGLNEVETIENCVRSLVENTYPNKEIIVIDDGSTDGMDKVCQRLVKQYGIKFYRHSQRTGKSAGSNHAFGLSRGEFVMIGDADTSFDRNAIYEALLPFSNPQVGAVSANLRVRNSKVSWITRMQAIEYLLGIGVGRRFLAFSNMLCIVSGAFGVYRRTAWESVGGMDVGPGEDADLTIKVRKAGYKIEFAPKAICMTNVPTTVAQFVKQRLRWSNSEIRFRIRTHRNLYHWRFFDPSSTIAMFDSIFFSIFLVFTRISYYSVLFSWRPNLIMQVGFATLLIYCIFTFIRFSVAFILSERKIEDLDLILFIPTFPVFSLIHSFARLYAYLDETLFYASFRDKYVPARVQKTQYQR